VKDTDIPEPLATMIWLAERGVVGLAWIVDRLGPDPLAEERRMLRLRRAGFRIRYGRVEEAVPEWMVKHNGNRDK
jgi:hypothetical protein